jgi:hypothetical protein
VKLTLATTFAPTTYDLVYQSGWFVAEAKPVEYSGTPGAVDFEVSAYYYPLWKFVGADEPGAVPVGTNKWGVKLAPDANLRKIIAYYQTAAAGPMFLVPMLDPPPRPTA